MYTVQYLGTYTMTIPDIVIPNCYGLYDGGVLIAVDSDEKWLEEMKELLEVGE